MAAMRTVFIDTSLSGYQSLAAQYDPATFNVVLLDSTSPYAGQIQNWMTANQAGADDIDIVSASGSINAIATARIVFIDPGVADIGTVIAGVPANATVVVLDAGRDGVQQIHDYLEANHVSGLAGVDIVSHGSSGEIMLGSTVLNGANLAGYGSQLAAIGSHLAPGADLQLYGCDVASGDAGQQFIASLAAATGADVAASTGLTGSAAAGGDWVLEASTGTIETAALNIAGYDGLLDAIVSVNAITMQNDTDPGPGIITNVAKQTISGTFSYNTGNTNVPTLWVSTDGTGASRTQVPATSISYNSVSKTGTFTVSVDLQAGTSKSIQFWRDGSTGTQIGTFQYTYGTDTTPPAAPSITGFSDNSGSPLDTTTNDKTPTLTITAEADARVDIYQNGLLVGTATQTALHSGTYTFTSSTLTDGSYSFTAKATDAAGNTSLASLAQAVVVDTTLTTPTLTLAIDGGTAGDGLTNMAGLIFSSADSDASRVITVDGSVVSSYDPSALSDGTHVVSVTDTDAAGNSRTNSLTFRLDTQLTAPSVGLTSDTGSAGDSRTNDARLTFNSADGDATRVITVDGNVVASYDPGALADGTHTVSVTDTDLAGNTRTKALTFTLDTQLTRPTVGLSSDTGTAGDGKTSDAHLDFNSADSDATRVITVDGNVVTSYDPSALQDGTHTVTVTDSDGANSKTDTVTFILDTQLTAPTVGLASDTGTAGDGKTNNAHLDFNAADGDATRVITVDGTVVSSYDPSALQDGTHTVTVTDSDGANSKTDSVTFTLDTRLTAPTVGLTSDTGTAGDGKTNNAHLDFNAADGDATRVITVDGKVVTTYDPSALQDGSHTVTVTDFDGANSKTGTVTFTLDTQLTTPSVGLSNDTGTAVDGLTRDASLSFNNADSDATRVITVDGNLVSSYDPSALQDGTHTVSITDSDGANSRTGAVTFTLDTSGPTFSSGASASVAENIGANQLVYRAAATDDHAFTYSLAGADADRFDIGADGGVTLKDNPNYEAKNAYAFTVVATDAAGNHSDQAVSLGITNVNEAPVATAISKTTVENAQINVQLAEYVSDPDAGDRLTYSLNTPSAKLCWANADSSTSTTLINPVTHAAVDISTLSVKASIAADGTVTIAPPAELDWMLTGQALKATFSYTVTDAAGLTSTDSINLVIGGSTNDKGVNLNGGNGDDTLLGNVSNNAEDLISGGNGNDTIYGYGGTDALYGGNGNDKLFGGAGIDYLYGDSGDDTIEGGSEGDFIFGGKGNDILCGGTGADKFVFAPQGGSDRITDFKLAEGDKLYFADIFATAPTVDTAFLSKYVTDTGNDLVISLPGGTSVVLVGVANATDLLAPGIVNFTAPV